MFCDHSSGYSVALFLYRKDAYARVRELMAAHDTAVASGCDDSADHAVKDAGQRTSTDDRTADGEQENHPGSDDAVPGNSG